MRAMNNQTKAKMIVQKVSLMPKSVSLKNFAAYDIIIYARKRTVTAKSLILKLMIVLLLSNFMKKLVYVKIRFF